MDYHRIISINPLVIPRLSLEYPLILLGLSWDYPWIFPGWSQDFPLIFPWSSLYYPLIIPGLSLDYPSIIPGLPLTSSTIYGYLFQVSKQEVTFIFCLFICSSGVEFQSHPFVGYPTTSGFYLIIISHLLAGHSQQYCNIWALMLQFSKGKQIQCFLN